jgi:nitroimidazol reductase NimA-like FMN-containing flavoprotein (pyridoxamine 5'-phosphate oxidase superfamily)
MTTMTDNEWRSFVAAGTKLAHVALTRSDGRPHVTPLVAVWLDGTLHFCTGPGEQKAVNLDGNPHVVLTTGCNQWDQGLDVMVEGKAERVTARATLERLATTWAAKWDGQWQYQVTDTGFAHDAGDDVLVFAVKPTKILAFTKGGFGQTRYLAAQGPGAVA